MKTFDELLNQINALPALKPTSFTFVTQKRSDGLYQTVKHEEYKQVDALRSEILSSSLLLPEKLSLIEVLSNKYAV